MALDKKALFEEMELKTETVKLRSGEVLVTELSAEDYMALYENPLVKDEKGEHSGIRFSALVCVRSMVDADGQRIMADEDATQFRKGSSGVFRKITAAANRVNGLTGDEIKN